jgi:Domain of unknown function (DUF5004)
MNNLFLKGIFLLSILTIFNACKPEPVYVLDPLGDPLAGINGKWQFTKVIQYDELRLQKALPISPIDVTTYFTSTATPTSITFKSSDKTYTVAANNSLNYLGTAGTFTFNDPNYPTKLTLTTSAGKVLDLDLSHAIRPNYNVFNAKMIRKINGKFAPSYTYSLKRQ